MYSGERANVHILLFTTWWQHIICSRSPLMSNKKSPKILMREKTKKKPILQCDYRANRLNKLGAIVTNVGFSDN